MDTRIVELFEYLEKNHPRAAQDIYCGLELLTNSIGDSIEYIARDIAIKSQKGDFSSISDVAEQAKKIQELRNILNDYIDNFSMKLSIENIPIVETDEEIEENETNLDYSKYAVDTEIYHTLSEDFTYKKICGFQFEGTRYNVNSWQDFLVQFCEILVDKDRSIFETFPEQQAFRGRKNNYLSRSSEGKRFFRKLRNADIYVWTNLCVALICEICKKVMRGYKLPLNSLYIFLRADFTQLHLEEDNGETTKIGKYVRDSMRKLSSEKYIFTDEMLKMLTSSQGTKILFRKSLPFFKQIFDVVNLSEQTKDDMGRSRYWKEIFEFNGNMYLINSQWYDYNFDIFDKWLEDLKKGQE